MKDIRHTKTCFHCLPDPIGVEDVVLCSVDEQMDIIKSKPHGRFYTRCVVKDKICSLAIDSICEVNLASTVLVETLNLPTIDHFRPYKLQGAVGDIWVTKYTLVPIQIGKYVDEVLHDVVPIPVTHMLLGKEWMLERGVKYDGHTNKYSFIFNDRHFAHVSLTYEQLCIDLSYMKSSQKKKKKKEFDP